MRVSGIMAAKRLNGSLLLLLAGVLMTLNSLVMQVSAFTCYEGFGLQTQVIANSTVNLREGELLVLQCNTTTDIYQYLELAGCTPPPRLPGPAPNTTGFCAIPGNYTSIVVHGFLKNSSMSNSVNLLEFDVEIHNLEQCLALVDARETPPSPCTTPPPIDDPATNASTTSNITETPTSTDTTDNHDRTETTAPKINDPGKIQQNNTKSEEIKDYTLYTAVCALGVIALVEFMVIVLLAEKLCRRECCGKKREREIAMENGQGEIRPGEMSRHSSTSDQDEEPVIINSGSMDVSREKVEEGATSTDQQQELEVMGKTSQLTSDKDKVVVQVIANEASIDVESTTNASKVVVAEVAKREEEEKEVVGEHSQQNSDTAKETVIANGDTCMMEAKERERTHGSSTDSINLTHATTNL